jgi:RNA polymerase sigma-70 factor (ECF subfamily)
MTFDEVYGAHFDFVWRTLRRLGVPPADVADVAQEVFLVVYRRLSDFEPRARVTSWLFPICLHAARDRRRRAHVRRETSVAEVESIDSSPGPQAGFERNEDLALCEAGLQEMSFEQRTVFVLYELEGFEGLEVAEALAVPMGTVRSRLRLAREAFRRGVLRAAARRAGPGARKQGFP